jgi:protoheme IX farnesyltransferase
MRSVSAVGRPARQTNWGRCRLRFFAAPPTISNSDDGSGGVKSAGALGVSARAGLYAELSKARLSSLVVVTAGAGYAAGCEPVDPATFAALCAGTSLAAGSANTFNQIIERNRDKTMKRTRTRPLPAGRIGLEEAMGWGIFTAGSSCALLAAGTNPVTAGLGAANIALYALPYTLSKPRTELNTWIGAVVGAVPPVMGWCASGGDLMSPVPILLGGTLFLWQFPHFFALAWIHRKDYARGGHQMVPVNDPTGERTARLIRDYSIYLLPVPVLAAVSGETSCMYAVEGITATGYMVHLAEQFKRDRSNENARRVFKCSLWYLPLLLALFVFHRNRDQHKVKVKFIDRVKARLREMCVHEAMVSSTGRALCPATDAVSKAGAAAAGQVAELETLDQ